MKKLPLFCVVFLAQVLAFSQSKRLLSFSVVPIDNDQKALVRWTMSAGSTCSDVVVERSRGNGNFQEIYVYPSICGNADSAVSYSWIDPYPLRLSSSFYRLKLDEIEFSLVSELNFNSKLSENEIIIFTNPNAGDFSLEFTNPNKERFDILVFTFEGTQILLDENHSGDSYTGKLPTLKTGIYFLRVQMQNNDSRTIKLFIR